MKLLKSIDERIVDLGFRKIREDKFCAVYTRFDEKYDYTQIIDIDHKKSGKHILSSYDPGLWDNKRIGHTCVGLTYEEMRLFTKKMKQMKKRWKKMWRDGNDKL